jgi:hypothetical protein
MTETTFTKGFERLRARPDSLWAVRGSGLRASKGSFASCKYALGFGASDATLPKQAASQAFFASVGGQARLHEGRERIGNRAL